MKFSEKKCIEMKFSEKKCFKVKFSESKFIEMKFSEIKQNSYRNTVYLTAMQCNDSIECFTMNELLHSCSSCAIHFQFFCKHTLKVTLMLTLTKNY